MSLNWINAGEYSINSFLLTERFQIRLMFGISDQSWRRDMGIVLRHNPAVMWYFIRRCPECADIIREIADGAPSGEDGGEARGAELRVLSSVEDFITYTTPEVMDKSCDFIYAWDPSRLLELADFADKAVLDVGSGSGRLAFAAATKAKEVYASEPVGTLREYLRDKIKREGIKNMRVSDGMAHELPYPDNTFDIVMSGHVVGDDYDAELAELTRVVKSGGWILDCPGESKEKRKGADELLRRGGWEELHYVSILGGDVYRYRKQIFK